MDSPTVHLSKSIARLLVISGLIVSGGDVKAQLIAGVEFTYGGERPFASGIGFYLGSGVAEGKVELDLLLLYGRRYTSESRPNNDVRSSYKSGEQHVAALSPIVLWSNLGVGISPKIGIAIQSISHWNAECPYCSFTDQYEVFYGVDLHWRALDWLQMKAGYSPINGSSVGVLVRSNLSFLRKS